MIWNSAKFLKSLSGWFTTTVTIESVTSTPQDEEGTPTKVWSVLHADIPCSPPFSPNLRLVGQVVRNPNETYMIDLRQINLKGVYRDVTEGMRVTIDGAVYLVELAYTDSQAVFTALLVREVDL
jgi:hypothetical protein